MQHNTKLEAILHTKVFHFGYFCLIKPSRNELVLRSAIIFGYVIHCLMWGESAVLCNFGGFAAAVLYHRNRDEMLLLLLNAGD